MAGTEEVSWPAILLGAEVNTGAWLVPHEMGDCPDDMWPLDHDIIMEET